jgi:DNA-binding transcriptional MerR regulator
MSLIASIITCMVTIDDLARKLGISKRAVRFRVNALSDLLEKYISRDEKNRLIFTGEAVVILRRLEELRLEERLPISKAAVRLRGELQKQEEDTSGEDDLGLEIKLEYLVQAVDSLRRNRDYWRNVAETMQSILPAERMWVSKLFPPMPGDPRLN